ncbi:hypothetical protein RRG08_046008 [Elysia crispata]|uniref:Sushi domain-containing protein 2 n=1 Tax=Elysia crispata TaxID=231223 RepID=A0AAE1DDN5_9GAST|nr:hypothetical protein RRG08_046008 [Elysia crispata]
MTTVEYDSRREVTGRVNISWGDPHQAPPTACLELQLSVISACLHLVVYRYVTVNVSSFLVRLGFVSRCAFVTEVNNNGIISFLHELRSYSPSKFPLVDPTPLIAPYWADVDISEDDAGNKPGVVWFRQTKEPAVLAQADEEIRAHQPSNRKFRASWVFVVTWEEVGFYGPVKEGKLRRNTFQAVLVVDTTEGKSFVIFNYARIDWTTGSNNNGDEITGLGGTPAQAGFNAGDMKNFYEIEGSREAAIINLTQTSNVEIPGKWIFRVDSEEIEDLCPVTRSSELTVSPSEISQLGGEVLTLKGTCLTQDDIVAGIIKPSNETLCCRMVERSKVVCVTPPVLDTGERRLEISVGQGDELEFYSAQILVKNLMDRKPKVQRSNPDQWLAGDQRKVEVWWDSADVDVVFQQAQGYRCEILQYRAAQGNVEIVWFREFHHTSNNRYRLEMPQSFAKATMSVAVVRITALVDICDGLGPSIFSDVFPVRPLKASEAAAQCSAWLTSEADLPPLDTKGQAQCPCTLEQAEGDTAQFSSDPFCTQASNSPLNCRYRPLQAQECILPNHISSTSGPFLCCYDKSGELLNAFEGGDAGGGTLERYSYRKSSVTSMVVDKDIDSSSNKNNDNNDNSNGSSSGNGSNNGQRKNTTTTTTTTRDRTDQDNGRVDISNVLNNSSSSSTSGNGGQNSGDNGVRVGENNKNKSSSNSNGSSRTILNTILNPISGNSSDGNSSDSDGYHSSSSSQYSTGNSSFQVTIKVRGVLHNSTSSNSLGNTFYLDPSSNDTVRENSSSSSSSTTTTTTPAITSSDFIGSSQSDSTTTTTTYTTPSTTTTTAAAPSTTTASPSITTTTATPSTTTISANPSTTTTTTTDTPSTNRNENDNSGANINPAVNAAKQSDISRDSVAGRVPFFSYMMEDIAPRLHCCQFSANQTLCDQFLVYRPPVTCQKYQSPSAAQAAGDPHIETLDGHAYTFNGLGYFSLLKIKDSPVVVQVKTSRAKNTQGQLENATVFTGLAVRGGSLNAPVLELVLPQDNITMYQIYVDGQLQESSAVAAPGSGGSGSGSNSSSSSSTGTTTSVSSWQVAEISVVESKLANQRQQIMFVLDDRGLSLLVEVMEELLNIIVVAGPQLKGKLEGLLGNYNGDSKDDFMSRDGNLLPADMKMREVHNRFGMSWQVSPNESLFLDAGDSDFLSEAVDQAFVEDDGQNEFKPEFIDEIVPVQQNVEIRTAPEDSEMGICEGNPQCMFDLKVTNNKNIALSTLKFNKRFEELKQEIQPVVRCPYVGNITNGNRTLTGFKIGDTVNFTCYHGYQMEMGGRSQVLTCLATGEWTEQPSTCVRAIDTGEDFPYIFVAIGAAAGAFLLVFLLSLLIRVVHQRFLRSWGKKSDSSSSSMDYDQSIELPTIFPISDIPSPVFENPLFLQRLQQLCDKGSFQIPRPTYVDPNIYSDLAAARVSSPYSIPKIQRELSLLSLIEHWGIRVRVLGQGLFLPDLSSAVNYPNLLDVFPSSLAGMCLIGQPRWHVSCRTSSLACVLPDSLAGMCLTRQPR